MAKTKEDKHKINVDEDDFHSEFRDRYEEGRDGLQEVHKEALNDLRMLINKDGTDQWNPQVKAYREALVPPRPVLTQNLEIAFGERVKNQQRQNRPQAKVNPVDDKADPATANVIGGLLRNIWYQSAADAVHDTAFDTLVDVGLGAWRVAPEYVDPMSRNQELRVRPIGSAFLSNPLSVLWDLSCKNFATSDKKWCVITETRRRADVESEFGEKFPDGSTSLPSDLQGMVNAGWFAKDEITIAEYWQVYEKSQPVVTLSTGVVVEREDGKIREAIAAAKRFFSKVSVIEEWEAKIPEIRTSIVSGNKTLKGPYKFPGQYIPIPITMGRVFSEEGRLHIKSLHRDAHSTQEIHNYLISSLVEQFALQPAVPWVGTKKMFEGIDDWTRANDGGIAFLPYNVDPQTPMQKPTREAPPQVSGQLFGWIEQNLQTLRNVYGIQQAGLGMTSNETSGRAINMRRQESDTSTFVFTANHLLGLTFEAKILVDLIPHYYKTEQAINITGVSGDQKQVFINQRVVRDDGSEYMYDLRVGKYDAVITIGPTAATQRDETAQLLGQVAPQISQTNPLMGQILGIELVKLINTPDNDRLVRVLKATLPPQVQALMDDNVDETGAPGGPGKAPDPRMVEMQQAFEQQAQQLVAQLQEKDGMLQKAGMDIQTLQAAIGDAKGREAMKDEELRKAITDFEMAKRELKVRSEEALLKSELKAGELLAELQAYRAAESKVQAISKDLAQTRMAIDSMDRAMELFIAKAKDDDGGEKIISAMKEQIANLSETVKRIESGMKERPADSGNGKAVVVNVDAGGKVTRKSYTVKGPDGEVFEVEGKEVPEEAEEKEEKAE